MKVWTTTVVLAGLAAGTGCAPVSATAGEGTGLALKAAWASTPCAVPAAFDVTLTSTSASAVYVPAEARLGWGGTLNLVAEIEGERLSTEVYFPVPRPPSWYETDDNFTLVRPGASHTYRVLFDGSFEVHGGPEARERPWRGQLRFYYSLSASEAERVQGLGPVLAMDADRLVFSNALICG